MSVAQGTGRGSDLSRPEGGPGAPPGTGGAPGPALSGGRGLVLGTIAILIALLIALAGVSGCASASPESPGASAGACPTCPGAIRTNGWCERCALGYVAGRAIPSALFHEALDAHGHEIDPNGLQCLECVEAIEVDGFCTRCRYGFVGGQLYFTELTWSLHRGRMRAQGEVSCPACRELHGGVGVCGRCGALWVGNVEFCDAALHARAAKQFRRLELALERLPRCEMCAAAGFFGRDCPKCETPPVPE